MEPNDRQVAANTDDHESYEPLIIALLSALLDASVSLVTRGMEEFPENERTTYNSLSSRLAQNIERLGHNSDSGRNGLPELPRSRSRGPVSHPGTGASAEVPRVPRQATGIVQQETAGQAASQDAAGRPRLSRRQIRLVLIGVMSGMFLSALDANITQVALPTIAGQLGGVNLLSWVVTAYLLTETAGMPLWGKIADLYGTRLIFQVSIAVFIIGSALCGISQNMVELIAFRALQGIGGGGLSSIALGIIGQVIPPRDRGRFGGYLGTVFGGASVLGPLLGGFLTESVGWRWNFYVNVPIGVIALITTSVSLRMVSGRRRDHKVDYFGAATSVGAITSLLLYLNWAPGEGWDKPVPLMLLYGSLALGAAFIFTELKASEPIIPMRLFRLPVFTMGNIYRFLTGAAMFGVGLFIPTYFQAVKGLSPAMSGVATLPMVVGLLMTSITVGRLMTRTGKYKIFPIMGAVLMGLAIPLFSQLSAATSFWVAALAQFLFGTGLGCTLQTVSSAIQNSVDRADIGVASSATTFFQRIGGVIGTTALGAAYSVSLAHYLAARLSGTSAKTSANSNNVNVIHLLAEPIRLRVIEAYGNALDEVFLFGLPIVVLAFLVAIFFKEVPLTSGLILTGRHRRTRKRQPPAHSS